MATTTTKTETIFVIAKGLRKVRPRRRANDGCVTLTRDDDDDPIPVCAAVTFVSHLDGKMVEKIEIFMHFSFTARKTMLEKNGGAGKSE